MPPAWRTQPVGSGARWRPSRGESYH
jgi:hypothetical protein